MPWQCLYPDLASIRRCPRCGRPFVPNGWDAAVSCSLLCGERSVFELPDPLEMLTDPPAVVAARAILAKYAPTPADAPPA
jgi:hypothetical protein